MIAPSRPAPRGAGPGRIRIRSRSAACGRLPWVCRTTARRCPRSRACHRCGPERDAAGADHLRNRDPKRLIAECVKAVRVLASSLSSAPRGRLSWRVAHGSRLIVPLAQPLQIAPVGGIRPAHQVGEVDACFTHARDDLHDLLEPLVRNKPADRDDPLPSPIPGDSGGASGGGRHQHLRPDTESALHPRCAPRRVDQRQVGAHPFGREPVQDEPGSAPQPHYPAGPAVEEPVSPWLVDVLDPAAAEVRLAEGGDHEIVLVAHPARSAHQVPIPMLAIPVQPNLAHGRFYQFGSTWAADSTA